MKRATIVTISGAKQERKLLIDQFEKCIPKEFKKYYLPDRLFGQFPFLTDSPELHEVLALADRMGWEYTLFSEVYYTKKELDHMPFFRLCLPYPLELEGTRVDDYGTVHEGKCPYCNRGGTLVGDVLIDRKFMRKYKMAILIPEFSVTEELKNAIEESGLTGVSFDHEVKDYKGREMPKHYVMTIHSVLPPMSDSAWLCPYGHPDKNDHDILYLQSEIQYEQSKLADAKDFNITAEFISNYKIPEIVISAKAKQFLKDQHVYAWYLPVTILPD